MADTIKTNLGPVTAYADAKAHGYTGTREEFGVLLANAGLNLKAAETAKTDAEAAKQAAETAQQAAASSASSASTSASTATTQAAAAKSSADAAASSATAAKASEAAAEKSAQGAAASESAAKAAQTAAETAKANADTAASNAAANATAAANSAVDAKKTLESIPADYSTLSRKVDDNTSGISELQEDLGNFTDHLDGYATKSKNLLKITGEPVSNIPGITCQYDALTGRFKFDGTSSSDAKFINIPCDFTLKSGTYFLQWSAEISDSFRFNVYLKSGNTVITNGFVSTFKEFTVNNDVQVTNVFVYVTSGYSTNYDGYFWLSEERTEYTKYGSYSINIAKETELKKNER